MRVIFISVWCVSILGFSCVSLKKKDAFTYLFKGQIHVYACTHRETEQAGHRESGRGKKLEMDWNWVFICCFIPQICKSQYEARLKTGARSSVWSPIRVSGKQVRGTSLPLTHISRDSDWKHGVATWQCIMNAGVSSSSLTCCAKRLALDLECLSQRVVVFIFF